jgi:F-type H+-transporting ATPase subunit b
MIRSWLVAGAAILVLLTPSGPWCSLARAAEEDEHADHHDPQKVKELRKRVEKLNDQERKELKDQAHKKLNAVGPTTLTPEEQYALELFHEPDNAFKGSLDLTIWSIAVFLVLFGVLYRFAWGPISKSLTDRELAIQQAADEARKAREDSEKMRAELQREMAQAQDKVREALDEGRRKAAALSEEMMTKARAEIQADRDRLRRELDLARDQALNDLWQQSTQLAALMSAKALGRQISMDDQQRLINEALAELGQASAQAKRTLASKH